MDDVPHDVDGDADGDVGPGIDSTADEGTDATDDADGPAGEPPFADELARARDLLDAPDLTAFAVGAVRDGAEVETTFSYRPDAVDADREGIQALTLLAAHLRVVADEAGVDPLTAATDAAALAERVAETGTDADGGAAPDDG
ncbi:MAG: hypothetical protein ABEH78_04025 [Haloferacaceae archaeon]